MDVFEKLDRILEKTKLKEAKKSAHPDPNYYIPSVGASDRAIRQGGSGRFPMATSYHGNRRVNPKTGKKEVYDQAKGWISA